MLDLEVCSNFSLDEVRIVFDHVVMIRIFLHDKPSLVFLYIEFRGLMHNVLTI